MKTSKKIEVNNSINKRIPGQLKGKIKIIGRWKDADKEIEKLFEKSEIFPE